MRRQMRRASLSVVTNDPASAQAAQEAAAIATTEVLDALKAAGVADADIATQSVNGPHVHLHRRRRADATGFQASQSLTVTLRDLTTAGATLDAVVAAAGNAARVDSLSTFVTDPSVALDQARPSSRHRSCAGRAVRPAPRLQPRTRGLRDRVEHDEPASADGHGRCRAGAEKVPTPVEAGTTQVSVSLSIAWSIED